MIMSPKRLWDNYDRNILPLDSSVISSSEKEQISEKQVYFNGEATAQGCTRIYARLCEPVNNADKKLVIIMTEPKKDIADIKYSDFTEHGLSVLAVDYAGDCFDKARFTLYPPSLGYGNYSDNLYEIGEDPQKTCWYLWTTVLLRSITYAESLGYGKIALLGVGLGGSNVIKAAAITDLPLCGISLFSPGFFPQTEMQDSLSEKVCVSVNGYAHMLKIPFFQVCCSNDTDSSLDDISDLYEQAAGKSLLYIAPRVTKSFTKDIKQDILYYIKHYLNFYTYESVLKTLDALEDQTDEEVNNGITNNTGVDYNVIADTEIGKGEFNRNNIIAPAFNLSVSGAEDKMYFTLKCTADIKEVKLYISHGVLNPAYRNWRTLPVERVGEDEYICYTKVYSSDKPVYAFSSITTNDGFIYGSPVIKRIPSSLHIKPTVINKHRLIYESDMGTDDFFSIDESFIPEVKEGPFGIGGICAYKGLCTYKLGDVAFSGESDSVLQFLIYSPIAQNVTFYVTDEDNFNTYSCTKFLTPDTDWTKIMLSISDLKSSEGALSGWNKAILLRIDAQYEILISSLLWV